MGRRKYRNIVIRGQVFATAQDAARHFGVHEETVMMAVRKGRLDTVGLGRAAQKPTPMPVVIAGRAFGSCGEAAQAFGVCRTTIWKAVDEGRAHRFGGPPAYGKRPGTPLTICGRRFPSMEEAARCLGISRSWLRRLVLRTDARSRERLLRAVMAYEARGMRRAA